MPPPNRNHDEQEFTEEDTIMLKISKFSLCIALSMLFAPHGAATAQECNASLFVKSVERTLFSTSDMEEKIYFFDEPTLCAEQSNCPQKRKSYILTTDKVLVSNITLNKNDFTCVSYKNKSKVIGWIESKYIDTGERPVGYQKVHQKALRGDAKWLKTAIQTNPALLEKLTPFDESPLYIAALAGKLDAVKVLLDLGADPSRTTKLGDTPYFAAKSLGHKQVAKLLEDRGAQGPSNVKDHFGNTAEVYFARLPEKPWDWAKETVRSNLKGQRAKRAGNSCSEVRVRDIKEYFQPVFRLAETLHTGDGDLEYSFRFPMDCPKYWAWSSALTQLGKGSTAEDRDILDIRGQCELVGNFARIMRESKPVTKDFVSSFDWCASALKDYPYPLVDCGEVLQTREQGEKCDKLMAQKQLPPISSFLPRSAQYCKAHKGSIYLKLNDAGCKPAAEEDDYEKTGFEVKRITLADFNLDGFMDVDVLFCAPSGTGGSHPCNSARLTKKSEKGAWEFVRE